MRLFRVLGITVYVHWTWFLVAAVQWQIGRFGAAWHVATYLTLFGIVLLHEFGHALACRSVGGWADRIVLWPLGGIAFVQPPPRPGPVLWSIAAGPLVNVLLVPVTGLVFILSGGLHTPPEAWTHWQWYVGAVMLMNFSLLAFNLLPIYPLDGGQMFQAVLWFFMGRARS
ncbi:MAG TPA: site-2 protease family protein, partial [Phycisphaeraceae bacterium]